MNKIYGILSATALLSSFSNCENKQDVIGEKPNVVFIVADDLGYNDLGCFGQKIIQTPNIDSLSRQGLKCTHSYSGTTVSAPSRACLMTGLHSGHSPIRGNFEIIPEGQMALPDSIMTIFKMFKNAGYATGAFGKWGLGAPKSEGAPENQYVDEFFGYNCQRFSHSYYPDHLYHNAEKILLHANDSGNSVIYAPDTIQYQTLKFIENHKDNPFFLFVPCVIPHAELIVPNDSLYHKYEGRFEEKPYIGCDYGCKSYGIGGYRSQEKPKATYAAMVSRFDLYVGQIVKKLKATGIYDNTIIVITSDNGPHWEGGNDPEFFNSNGIYRGYKRDLYEGGIRVPTVIVWSKKIEPDTTNFMFAFWDYLPTFAEITGEPIPTCDGISILPLLLGKKQVEHEYLYFEFQELGGRQCLRKGDWKLIKLDVKNQRQFELYNIKDDPEEKNNLSERHPDILEDMKSILENERTENPNWNF
jgi:Arylsulfatase A and related enzymes